MLQRRSSFTYVSVIDITSQFYHFNLDSTSRQLCVITTPFGLYQYLRLPMGIKIAPSFAQSVMDSLFGQNVYVEVFMDDIAIFSTGSFTSHLETLRKVFALTDPNVLSRRLKWIIWFTLLRRQVSSRKFVKYLRF